MLVENWCFRFYDGYLRRKESKPSQTALCGFATWLGVTESDITRGANWRYGWVIHCVSMWHWTLSSIEYNNSADCTQLIMLMYFSVTLSGLGHTLRNRMNAPVPGKKPWIVWKVERIQTATNHSKPSTVCIGLEIHYREISSIRRTKTKT